MTPGSIKDHRSFALRNNDLERVKSSMNNNFQLSKAFSFRSSLKEIIDSLPNNYSRIALNNLSIQRDNSPMYRSNELTCSLKYSIRGMIENCERNQDSVHRDSLKFTF